MLCMSAIVSFARTGAWLLFQLSTEEQRLLRLLGLSLNRQIAQDSTAKVGESVAIRRVALLVEVSMESSFPDESFPCRKKKSHFRRH